MKYKITIIIISLMLAYANNKYVQKSTFSIDTFKLLEKYLKNKKSTNKVLKQSIYNYFNHLISTKCKAGGNLVFTGSNSYKLDDLILFNSDSTKFISTINISNRARKNSAGDWVNLLIGRKVYNKWYFFLGANLVVPRKNYRYDKYEPLSFLEISFVAREQLLSPFYYIADDKITIKQEAINEFVKLPVHVYGNDNETDENIKHYVDNYIYKDKYIAQEDYIRIKAEIDNSVRPITDSINKMSIWDKIRGNRPPIFERDEWKNYVLSFKK